MSTERGHNPSQSASDINDYGRLFSIETARQIVRAVGIPPMLEPDDCHPDIEAEPDEMLFAQLAYQLNTAAQWWCIAERDQTSATPAMRADLADQIAAKCAGLLATMCGPNGELLNSLGPGGLWAQAAVSGAASGKEALAAVLSEIKQLQGWASAMAARDIRDARGKRSAGRPPDEAFNQLLAALGGIFLSYWRRPPTLARDAINNAAPKGPFFRFVSAVLYEMDDARPEEAIAMSIRRNPVLKAMREMGK